MENNFHLKDSSAITNIFSLKEALEHQLAFFFEVLAFPLHLLSMYCLESFNSMSPRMKGHCNRTVKNARVNSDNASCCTEERKQKPKEVVLEKLQELHTSEEHQKYMDENLSHH